MNRWIVYWLVALVMFGCSLLYAIAGQRVSVGIYENYPKVFIDNNGKPSGFFVDLIDAIAVFEAWELNYIHCVWSECLNKLERDEIDIMVDVAYSTAREKRFDFGQETILSSWSAVYKKVGSDISSILDLDGKMVAVLKDSIQYHTLKERSYLFDITPVYVEVEEIEQAFDMLEKNKVDCVVANRFYVTRHKKEYELEETNILISPTILKFAFPKNSQDDLIRITDSYIKRFKQKEDSVYHNSLRHWLMPAEQKQLPRRQIWIILIFVIALFILGLLILLFRRLVNIRNTELNQQKAQYDHLAHHDRLTNLPNRMLFFDRLEQAIRKAKRHGTSFAVLFIDLDNFKQINDSFGHQVGDDVLRSLSLRLKDNIREADTMARLGGDEFTFIMESLQNSNQAATVASKLIVAIQHPIRISGHEFYLTTSIGISLYPQDGVNPHELLKNADAAMYRAKEEGRNTFQFYTEDMTSQAVRRITMESNLRQALEHQELALHYQPQICLDTGRLIGMEALIRWPQEKLGMIPPGEFIPVAEQTGLIIPLSEWVLRTACSQWSEWIRMGFKPGLIAVNLSGKQPHIEGLLSQVVAILEETGFDPHCLELEITESFIMRESGKYIPILNRFRALGIKLTIDDFGTGYSSMDYLKRLPISKLKIDRSFIKDIPNDQNDAAISRAMIALGKSLNLRVLAKGVETEAQSRFLKTEGCDEVQGFLFARPLSAAEMTTLLSSNPHFSQGYQVIMK